MYTALFLFFALPIGWWSLDAKQMNSLKWLAQQYVHVVLWNGILETIWYGDGNKVYQPDDSLSQWYTIEQWENG